MWGENYNNTCKGGRESRDSHESFGAPFENLTCPRMGFLVLLNFLKALLKGDCRYHGYEHLVNVASPLAIFKLPK